jgi:phenylpyruvate tautomerase
MPYLKIEINKVLDKSAEQELLKKASAFTATLLNKPEKWIMVSIFQGVPMMFDGSVGPIAYLELKSIGLGQDKCAELSHKLCAFINAELGISPNRAYIEFWDINGKMFGWNGETF